jgi:oligopeptide transport system substrate-binding protein
MFAKKFATVVLLVLAVAMVITSCAPAEKLETTLMARFPTEPPTFDPNLTTDTTSVQGTFLMFMGLTKLNIDDMSPEPWLATKWDISDDGLVYTFHMRKDVQWVDYDPATGNAEKKRPVNAHDVEFGTKRTCNPETASDYAYVNYVIKNCMAVNTGESTDLDSIGVKALDDYTVEYTLAEPAPWFPAIASMWINFPNPIEVVEAHPDDWFEAENVWTCGPYMMHSWEHGAKVVFKKNPHWFDAKNVSIETIDFLIVEEDSTALAMYENGEIDYTAAPIADLDRIKADPVLSKELNNLPRACQYHYGYNTIKPPFDNVKVRQAFSYALDRQKLIGRWSDLHVPHAQGRPVGGLRPGHWQL